jgi:hypothetical protein
MMGAQAIKAGDAECVVAGGQESMSTVPHYLFSMRGGQKLGDTPIKDGVILDGLWCTFNDSHMIDLAQYTAEKAGLRREELDAFSVKSQQKAGAAIAAGKFDKEMAVVTIPQRKGDPLVVKQDESVRPDTTLEALARLGAVTRDKGGMITAGNAPGLNDGGAALVLMSGARAKQKGARPLGRVVAYATGGTEPKDLFFAPIDAVQKLMKKMGVGIGPLRPDRGQRGLRGAGPGRRQRAGLGLGPRQRERGRGGARPPDRRLGRAHPGDAALRPGGPRAQDRARHALPGRRQRGGAGGRAGLTRRTVARPHAPRATRRRRHEHHA